MQFTGQITHALEVKTGEKKAGGSWTSQDFVMSDMADQYPKSVVFSVWENKINLVVGETCTVHLESKAKEYNGRWYNEIRAWRKENSVAPVAPPARVDAPVAGADDSFMF